MKKFNFTVYLNKPKRVDMYLSALFQDISRSYIQKLIDDWKVTINSKIVKKNLKVENKDEIVLELTVEKLDVLPENLPLDIVFEDDNIVIVNKDAWINTHPVPWRKWRTWTLVNALLYHVKDLAWIGGVERPWIVHRLDKDTSGLLMIAKNDKMMQYLQKLIKDRVVRKEYIAIVNGVLKDKKVKIESYIWRHPTQKIKMTVRNPINPKLAITHWKLIWIIDNKYSVVKVLLETWRTHQIRVHFASIGHPIIWDKVYGIETVNEEVKNKFWLKRQALHAYELEFELYEEMRVFAWDVKEDIGVLLKSIS